MSKIENQKIKPPAKKKMLETMTCMECSKAFPTWYNTETNERWYQPFQKKGKRNLKRKRKLTKDDEAPLKFEPLQELLCLKCRREGSFIALTEKNALKPNKFASESLASLSQTVREMLQALKLVPEVLENLIVEYLLFKNELWYMFLAHKKKKNSCVESVFFIPSVSSLLYSFSVDLYTPKSYGSDLLDLNICQNVLQVLEINFFYLRLRQLNLDELSVCTKWSLVGRFRRPKCFDSNSKTGSISVIWDDRNEKLWFFAWISNKIWSTRWNYKLQPWREDQPELNLVEELTTASNQEKKSLFSSMTSWLSYFSQTAPNSPPLDLAFYDFHCILETASRASCHEKTEIIKRNIFENQDIIINQNNCFIRIKHNPCGHKCIKDCSLYLDTIAHLTDFRSTNCSRNQNWRFNGHQNCLWYLSLK